VAATVVPTPNPTGWYRSEVGVTWGVTAPAGLATTSGCDPTTLTADTPGTTLTCTVTDSLGRPAEGTAVVRIDTSPPSTVASVCPAPTAGWINRQQWLAGCNSPVSGPLEGGTPAPTVQPVVLANLRSTDALGGSGVQSITYHLEGLSAGPPVTQPYRDPTNIVLSVGAFNGQQLTAPEGRQTLTFGATDLAGNVEAPQSLTVGIDLTPPVLDVQPPPSEQPGMIVFYPDSFTVTLSATDNLSGVAAIEYAVDDDGFRCSDLPPRTCTPYTGPFTISGPGNHTLHSIAFDAAGNWQWRSDQFLTISTVTVPGAGAPGGVLTSTPVATQPAPAGTATATTGTSGTPATTPTATVVATATGSPASAATVTATSTATPAPPPVATRTASPTASATPPGPPTSASPGPSPSP
jgi:hypothetical protein